MPNPGLARWLGLLPPWGGSRRRCQAGPREAASPAADGLAPQCLAAWRARGCHWQWASLPAIGAASMGGWVEEPGQPRRGSVSDGRTIHRAGGAGRLLGSPSMGARVGKRGEGNGALSRQVVSIEFFSRQPNGRHPQCGREERRRLHPGKRRGRRVGFPLGRRLGTPPALHRDDAAACCSNSTRKAATSMHEMGTPLPNPICPI